MIINLYCGDGNNPHRLPVFSFAAADGNTYNFPGTTNKGFEVVSLPSQENGNFVIRFLQNGKLTFSKLNSAKKGMEACCIGGGGGGGGGWVGSAHTELGEHPNVGAGRGGGRGGYVSKEIFVQKKSGYSINIGAGGKAGHGYRGHNNTDPEGTHGGWGGSSSVGTLIKASGGYGGVYGQAGFSGSPSGGESGRYPFNNSSAFNAYGASGGGGWPADGGDSGDPGTVVIRIWR